jgi:hypothetical protein
MDFITYTLTAFVGFIGLFVGLLFAKFSPNEVHNLKKYIPDIQLALTSLAFIIFFIYFPFAIASLIFILSFSFIFLFWQKRDINTLDYIVFSILFAIGSLDFRVHYYLTAVIFIFGLFAGTLFYVLHDKPEKHRLMKRGHHIHSGEQLDFDQMSVILFRKYLFFFILCVVNYLIANLFFYLI